MLNVEINAQRIKSHYVGEDGIQIMVPYVKGLTIFDGAGILYHQYENSELYTNKYIEDNRRFSFPYSNIPVHYRKIHGYKFTMTNQLFDFDTPYVAIGNGGIVEYYVLKENDDAILVKKYFDISNSKSVKTRDEVENILKYEENYQKYLVQLDGSVIIASEPLDSEKDIHNYIKRNLEKYIKYLHRHYDVYQNDFQLRLAEKNIENNDYGNIMKVNLLECFVVRISNTKDIDLKYLHVDYVADDCYEVVEEYIPVRKYNLDMVKCLVKKEQYTKEPKISLSQNPNISKQDLKLAKQKVKELKK